MPIALPAVVSDSHEPTIEWKLKIDKLTLLLDLPEKLKDGLIGYYIGLIADQTEHFTHGISRSYSPGFRGYAVSLQGRVPLSTSPLMWGNDAAYFLQVGPKKPKLPMIRLDINPEGLTPAGMAHLREKLDGIFGIPWLTWRFSRVSRIDAAVDLHGVDLTKWAWDVPKRPSRELICRGREVRTVYLGAKKKTPLVVYNKAKQDPAMAGNGPVTRVEYRAKNLGPILGLPELANPLRNVVVLDPSKLAHPAPHRAALMWTGHLHGWWGILDTFPGSVRKAVENELKKTCAAWWDPKAIWDSWSKCLMTTLPHIYAPSAETHDTVVAYKQAIQAEKFADSAKESIGHGGNF